MRYAILLLLTVAAGGCAENPKPDHVKCLEILVAQKDSQLINQQFSEIQKDMLAKYQKAQAAENAAKLEALKRAGLKPEEWDVDATAEAFVKRPPPPPAKK